MAKKASKKSSKKASPKATGPTGTFAQTQALRMMPELVQQTFGDNAVMGSGMVLVGGGRTVEAPEASGLNGKAKVVIAGIVIADKDFANGDGEWQRWDCDVILIPRRIRTKNTIYRGASVDSYITGGLQDERGWSEEVFPEKKKLDPDV